MGKSESCITAIEHGTQWNNSERAFVHPNSHLPTPSGWSVFSAGVSRRKPGLGLGVPTPCSSPPWRAGSSYRTKRRTPPCSCSTWSKARSKTAPPPHASKTEPWARGQSRVREVCRTFCFQGLDRSPPPRPSQMCVRIGRGPGGATDSAPPAVTMATHVLAATLNSLARTARAQRDGRQPSFALGLTVCSDGPGASSSSPVSELCATWYVAFSARLGGRPPVA